MLWERAEALSDMCRLPLPGCLRWEPLRRQLRIFRFHVSNMEPSGSRVANSGFSKDKTFLKGNGHQRRLWSVLPQLQQRPRYWAQAWRRASSVRSGVHKDRLVFIVLLVTVQTIS